MSWSLGSLFVEFGSKGFAALKGQFSALQGGLNEVVKAAQSAYSGLTSFIGGWVRMGLEGTAEGNRLNATITQLAREIAAVFLPVVEKITEYLGQLVAWFQDLDESTQDSIATWIGWAVAIVGVVVVLAQVASAIGVVVSAVQGLIAAFAVLNIETAGILLIIGALVAGLYALYRLFTDVDAEADKKSKARSHRQVTLAGGGFESVESTYKRLQSAALKLDAGGADYNKATADHTKQLVDLARHNNRDTSRMAANQGAS